MRLAIHQRHKLESQGQGLALLGALRTEPLEFMQRLAALVPRPRLHLIRFHGVLAPNAKLRPAIVPSASTDANAPAPDQAESPHPSP